MYLYRSTRLKDLCKELLNIELSNNNNLPIGEPQRLRMNKCHAASDVLYLHKIKEILASRLAREKEAIAKACFDFIGTRASLDLLGLENEDIFSHM